VLREVNRKSFKNSTSKEHQNKCFRNTFSQHKEIYKEYTREVKNMNDRSVIDYLLINKRNRTDVKDVMIRRRTEKNSDNNLLKARIRMKNRR